MVAIAKEDLPLLYSDPQEDPYRRLAVAILLRGFRDWKTYEDEQQQIDYAYQRYTAKDDPWKITEVARHLKISLHVAHQRMFLASNPPPNCVPHCVGAKYLNWHPDFVRKVYQKFKENPTLQLEQLYEKPLIAIR